MPYDTLLLLPVTARETHTHGRRKAQEVGEKNTGPQLTYIIFPHPWEPRPIQTPKWSWSQGLRPCSQKALWEWKGARLQSLTATCQLRDLAKSLNLFGNSGWDNWIASIGQPATESHTEGIPKTVKPPQMQFKSKYRLWHCLLEIDIGG